MQQNNKDEQNNKKYNWQIIMIGKITGYAGFRTYGELPYPTMKQGKQLVLANKVWESTVRPTDHIDPLQNYHNNKTVYTKSYLENTYPWHYYKNNVKGGSKSSNMANSSIKAYDKQQAEKYKNTKTAEQTGGDPRKTAMLKTGTEHWKSIYDKTYVNPRQGMSLTGSNFNNGDNLNNANNNNSLDKGDGNQNNNLAASGNNQDGGDGQSGNKLLGVRSSSLGGKTRAQLFEEQARKNSYKYKPYINNAKTGITEYKFNYGQKIGDSPMDLMNKYSMKQPFRNNPLKRGTNQMWTEIPNYQGFKPSQLSYKQYKQKIEERPRIDKGNLKLQTADNFHTQVPGYGGFKPKFQQSLGKLRQSILSTNLQKNCDS